MSSCPRGLTFSVLNVPWSPISVGFLLGERGGDVCPRGERGGDVSPSPLAHVRGLFIATLKKSVKTLVVEWLAHQILLAMLYAAAHVAAVGQIRRGAIRGRICLK